MNVELNLSQGDRHLYTKYMSETDGRVLSMFREKSDPNHYWVTFNTLPITIIKLSTTVAEKYIPYCKPNNLEIAELHELLEWRGEIRDKGYPLKLTDITSAFTSLANDIKSWISNINLNCNYA